MDFDLSDDQALYKASVERFVEPVDVEARARIRRSDQGYDRDRWRALAELGLLALPAGEDQGGMGGSRADLVVVAEAIGSGNAPDPWLENGALPIRLLAAARDSERIAPLLDGGRIAAFAFAEPSQRYGLDAQDTVATPDGDGFTLSGEKHFVLGGAMADLLLVTAKHDDETALFAVEADAQGIDRRAYRVADGSIAAVVTLRDVALDASARLALDNATLETIVDEARLLASAEMVGLAQRLLDDTLGYVKEREQFGVPISSFQVIQHRLVDCYAALEQMRSMLLRATLDESGDSAVMAGAKALIADKADLIAREAIQFHGGMGVTDELAIGHAAKRVMLLARLFGDSADNLVRVAEAA